MLQILADEVVSTNGFPYGIVIGVVILVFFLIVLLVVSRFLGLYVQAFVSGAHVGMQELLGMRLRKVNAFDIVTARIQAIRAGLQIGRARWRATFWPAGTFAGSSAP